MHNRLSRVPQMNQSLDDWAKTGKRPMTVTIIDTGPQVTKIGTYQDHGDQGFPHDLPLEPHQRPSRRKRHRVQQAHRSHHLGAEERLRAHPGSAAVIAIFMAFGLSYSTLTTVYKTSVD